MRLSRKLLSAGAAIGLIAAAGTALAQEHATRTIKVPADAVVLVLPPGARVMSPGQTAFAPGSDDEAMPLRFGNAPRIDAMFQQMDAQMNAMMLTAEHGFAMPMMGPMMSPERTIPAMMSAIPAGASGVVVTSFSDGGRSCTQRMVYSGNGAAPVIQTSGDACGAVSPQRMVPAAEPEQVVPRTRGPRLIEAAAHRRVRPYEVASLAR